MKEKVPNFFLLLSMLAVASCKNIYHGMTETQLPGSLPLLPRIEYTYPGNRDTGVPVNRRFIMVGFNKDMDFSTLDGSEFEISRVGVTRPAAPPQSPFNERIIILSPGDFMPGSWYRVTLTKSLADTEGNVFHAGYSWLFKTLNPDDDGYRDLTPPEVAITPASGNFVRAEELAEITAEFSENINPNTVAMTVEKVGSPPVPVDGTVRYAVTVVEGEPRWTATFTPNGQIEKSSYFTVRVSGTQDLAGNTQAPDPVDSVFRTDSIRVDLESARNINYGSATFGDAGGRGHALLDVNGEYLDKRFTADGASMAALFDSGASGPLEPGRYVRIVVGGRNIMEGIGPDTVILEPVYRNLSGGIVSPPGNRCYVDPRDGRFVLPRPSYWSKLDSKAEVESPQIHEETPTMPAVPSHFPAGKWGRCMQFYSTFSFQQAWALYPFGNNCMVDRGTMSFWFQIDESGYPVFTDCHCTIYFGGPGNFIRLHGNNTLYLFVNGKEVYHRAMAVVNTKKWHHLYVLWDLDDTTGITMRIFLDKNEMPPLTTSWTSGAFYLGVYTGLTPYMTMSIKLDNLKIWKHVVSPDPEWEFNADAQGAGQGRENALHYNYGPADPATDPDLLYDYCPRLVLPDSGVGYYY